MCSGSDRLGYGMWLQRKVSNAIDQVNALVQPVGESGAVLLLGSVDVSPEVPGVQDDLDFCVYEWPGVLFKCFAALWG